MIQVLVPADITTLRREWLGDEVDLRPSWGAAAHLSAGASIGAATLALAGMGVGSVTRGTRFYVVSAGVPVRYAVTSDATITAGAVTVGISPLLAQAATANDAVQVEPVLRSTFNKQLGREYFSDVDIEDLAHHAMERYGPRIQMAPDQKRALYRSIKLLALQAMLLPGSEYRQALAAADQTQQGRTEIASMEAEIRTLESEVAYVRKGPGFAEVFR